MRALKHLIWIVTAVVTVMFLAHTAKAERSMSCDFLGNSALFFIDNVLRRSTIYFDSEKFDTFDGVAFVETCIAQGKDPNERNENGQTPLHFAVESGSIWGEDSDRIDIIEVLIEHGARVDSRDNNGNTPLHNAAMWSRGAATIELLIRHGATADAQDKHGNTPLHIVALRNDDPTATEMLIRHGADVNARSENGRSLFWLENPYMIDAILGYFGIVDTRGWSGSTPLHYATLNENSEIIEVLLEAGADGSIRDDEGRTAFDYIEEDSPHYGTDTYWRLHDAQFE